MKKRLILATIAAFAVSGAGAQQPSGKVLVAYFSHSGNTREVARQISEATGGDLFEIVPATPYPTEYRAVVDQGKKEIEAGVRPALKNPVGDLSQYDVIFVGSPCWWATIAPPVATFLTSCDLAGKTVIRRLCPRSTVPDGLAVRGSAVRDSKNEVGRWVRARLKNGF